MPMPCPTAFLFLLRRRKSQVPRAEKLKPRRHPTLMAAIVVAPRDCGTGELGEYVGSGVELGESGEDWFEVL